MRAPALHFPRVRDRLGEVAQALQPILNRVVLAGPAAIDLLTDDPDFRASRLAYAADLTLQLLSSSMIDRIGTELQKAGLARVGRTARADRWRLSDGIEVELIQVSTGDAEDSDPWREYATLLTLPIPTAEGVMVRVAGAPALLALELAPFERNAGRLTESEEIERAIQLIAGRVGIERECEAAPAELRGFIASALARVVANDTVHLLIQRVIPDAEILPELAERVRARMKRIAGWAAR